MNAQELFDNACWHLLEQPMRTITEQGLTWSREADGASVVLYAEGDGLLLDVLAENELVARFAIDAETHEVRCLRHGEHVASIKETTTPH